MCFIVSRCSYTATHNINSPGKLINIVKRTEMPTRKRAGNASGQKKITFGKKTVENKINLKCYAINIHIVHAKKEVEEDPCPTQFFSD